MPSLTFDPMMESRPIREIAYEVLKHAIVTGEIPAGERIVETEYADKLHISRTPLREALRKLERDGLVEYAMRRGVVVRAFTIADIEEIYTIRNALEMLTIPSVVKNTTDDDIMALEELLVKMDKALKELNIEELVVLNRQLHQNMLAISKMSRVLRVIESQEEYIVKFSGMSIANDSRRESSHQEHHELVRLLKERDLDALTALWQKHIEQSKRSCLYAVRKMRPGMIV
jgi:DNA-binding GntR family transcriptional regulator